MEIKVPIPRCGQVVNVGYCGPEHALLLVAYDPHLQPPPKETEPEQLPAKQSAVIVGESLEGRTT